MDWQESPWLANWSGDLSTEASCSQSTRIWIFSWPTLKSTLVSFLIMFEQGFWIFLTLSNFINTIQFRIFRRQSHWIFGRSPHSLQQRLVGLRPWPSGLTKSKWSFLLLFQLIVLIYWIKLGLIVLLFSFWRFWFVWNEFLLSFVCDFVVILTFLSWGEEIVELSVLKNCRPFCWNCYYIWFSTFQKWI